MLYVVFAFLFFFCLSAPLSHCGLPVIMCSAFYSCIGLFPNHCQLSEISVSLYVQLTLNLHADITKHSGAVVQLKEKCWQ